MTTNKTLKSNDMRRCYNPRRCYRSQAKLDTHPVHQQAKRDLDIARKVDLRERYLAFKKRFDLEIARIVAHRHAAHASGSGGITSPPPPISPAVGTVEQGHDERSVSTACHSKRAFAKITVITRESRSTIKVPDGYECVIGIEGTDSSGKPLPVDFHALKTIHEIETKLAESFNGEEFDYETEWHLCG